MKKLLLPFILMLAPILALAAPGDNFHPCQTLVMLSSTVSANYAIGACGAATLNVECYNEGSKTVFIAGGVGSATATTPTSTAAFNNYPLGAGLDKIFDLGSANYIALLSSSGNNTVYCTSGGGQ